MTRISDDTIRRIKETMKVVDVLNECGVKLVKKGVNYVGLCPFHNDQTVGNFVVSPSKNIYKCFACGETGNGLTYLMKKEKLTYIEAIKWLGELYCIEVGGEPLTKRPTGKVKAVAPIEEAPLKLLTLPIEMVRARENTQTDTLCNWLRGLPWGPLQREAIEQTLRAYHVGASKEGKTIWWQIDVEGRVRTGKLMRYKADGHRDRTEKNSFDWIHSRLKRAGWWNDKEYEMQTCLFGEHLIRAYPKATVNIVESEKTAVIMAIAYGNPQYNIWLATGGKSMLSRGKLLPLIEAKRKILLYPDQDGIEQWRKKMQDIGYVGMRLAKSLVVDPNSPKKDCGDFIVEKLYEIAEMNARKGMSEREEEPTLEELAQYDEEQCKLINIIRENFVVDTLITTFDLELTF